MSKIKLTYNYDYVIRTKLLDIKYEIDRINDNLHADILDNISNKLMAVISYYDRLGEDLKESESE